MLCNVCVQHRKGMLQKGSNTIKDNFITKTICCHRMKIIGLVLIFCVELSLSFRFFIREPVFPMNIFIVDASNAIFRDLLLVSIFLLVKNNISRIKQVVKDYFPIVIIATLWTAISMVIIHSLNLLCNIMTLIALLAGVINNSLLVLAAGILYTKWSTRSTKAVYFLAYLVTLLFFYSDTAYFIVTSNHIEKMLFENLNNYSILSVIHTTDKLIFLGIGISLISLILLFRTPNKRHYGPAGNSAAIILFICLTANLINFSTAYFYPKLLLTNGYDEEAELERARNASRSLLSQSVALNLAQEFLRDDERLVAASSQLYRVAFSEEEALLLNDLGIKVGEKPAAVPNVFPYDRIIMIVGESLHRDYLHHYNPLIPAEATPFLDSLVAAYPHSDRYYTSNKPTTQGLNSLFLSQLLYTEDQAFENNTTLFRVLEKNGYDTLFLEATSQYYNDEFRAYKKRFGMNTYRAKEDLEKEGYIGSSGWGFHNDVMYEETVRIMEQNRNKKFFMVTKTIDSHQPYPYCGLTDADIPAAIKDQPNNVYLKGIYWENITLQKFFQDLKDRNLLDDKTLIVITSDHNPHPSQNAHYKRLGEGDLTLSLAPLPLIFVSKNLKPFENFSGTAYASQIDFAPTLLGILGIPAPSDFSGRNMINVPEEGSYAVGFLGDTIYYWSSDFHMKTDMYNGKDQNPSEKALIHWVQDLYAKYFVGDSVRALQ